MKSQKKENPPQVELLEAIRDDRLDLRINFDQKKTLAELHREYVREKQAAVSFNDWVILRLFGLA